MVLQWKICLYHSHCPRIPYSDHLSRSKPVYIAAIFFWSDVYKDDHKYVLSKHIKWVFLGFLRNQRQTRFHNRYVNIQYLRYTRLKITLYLNCCTQHPWLSLWLLGWFKNFQVRKRGAFVPSFVPELKSKVHINVIPTALYKFEYIFLSQPDNLGMEP